MSEIPTSHTKCELASVRVESWSAHERTKVETLKVILPLQRLHIFHTVLHSILSSSFLAPSYSLCQETESMICFQKCRTVFYCLPGGAVLSVAGNRGRDGIWYALTHGGLSAFPSSVTQWILRSQVPLLPQEALHVVQSPKRQPNSEDPNVKKKRKYPNSELLDENSFNRCLRSVIF